MSECLLGKRPRYCAGVVICGLLVVVRLVRCTETTLEADYGSEMNIKITATSPVDVPAVGMHCA